MKRFKNILCVADSTADSSAALKRAAELAINNQAKLTLVSVVAELPRDTGMAILALPPGELLDSVIQDTQDELEDLLEVANLNIDLQVATNVLVGRPFLEIIKEVLRKDYDLVIKAVKPKTGTNRLFGSTDMHLMRKCPCPVWLIKPTIQKSTKRILAAVDEDPEETKKELLNRDILTLASSLAISESSELHVVHAWNLAHEDLLRSRRLSYSSADIDAMVMEEERDRKEWLQQLVAEHTASVSQEKVSCDLHLVKGHARHEVPELVSELNVDLVVMGTLGRSGIPGFFMGNTAEDILEQIDCSVLTIKPPGFVSPISLI